MSHLLLNRSFGPAPENMLALHRVRQIRRLRLSSLATIPSCYFKTLRSRPAFVRNPGHRVRSYHSDQYPPPRPFPPHEDAILSRAILHVPGSGFSTRALQLGAEDAGYPEVSTQLFPRGVFDLIRYHLVTRRLALKTQVQFPDDTKLSTKDKVRTLALERLRANETIIHQWQLV